MSQPLDEEDTVVLSAQELEASVREHIRAEGEFDLDALRETLHDDVAYEIKAPAYPDDPTPYGQFTGAETYLAMWERLHEIFSSYEIVLEDVLVNAEAGQAWLRIQATAVPRADWNGLPAGKPIRWWAAAICEFDEQARMTREIVYGSFPPTLAGLARMREFVGQ